jgi:hypothetical protein
MLGALVGLVGLPLAPGVAEAQPVPPVLPWAPGPPVPVSPTMGSYTFAPNWITSPAPTGFDARGVRAVAGVDPTMAANGMPGSALGLGPNKSNLLTSSSTRYRVGAGLSPNPSLPTVAPGTNIGAGMEVPTLEDPGGAPPKTAPGAESAQPTTAPVVPGQPAPILEAASGTEAPATPSPTPAPPAGPPTPEVAAQSAPPNP